MKFNYRKHEILMFLPIFMGEIGQIPCAFLARKIPRLPALYIMHSPPPPPELKSTCHCIVNDNEKIWHLTLGVANNMHPLSWGRGEQGGEERIILIFFFQLKKCVNYRNLLTGGGGGWWFRRTIIETSQTNKPFCYKKVHTLINSFCFSRSSYRWECW